MKIVIGYDHAAYEIKDYLISNLKDKYIIIDLINKKNEKINYAESAIKVAEYVKNKNANLGIIICGTGVGVSIAANKVKGIRCALCNNVEVAKLAKEHNNANMIAIGARITSKEEALNIINAFLSSKFEKGRHIERLETISKYENRK